jgi:Glycosyltransferase family 9 (heptosyltransferase)
MLSGDVSPQVWRGWLRPRKWPFPQPRWTGEPRPGQTIFLWEDYTFGPRAFGLGDMTQMVRLVPVVKAHSQARVILGVPRGVKRLFLSLLGADAIVEPPFPTEGFDVQSPLPVLPMLPSCELTAEWLSAAVPYLHADPALVAKWAPTFADRSLVHVGLHWRADPNHEDPKQSRSVPLDALAPLLSTPGVRFYSLPYDGGNELKAYPEVVDLGNVDHPGERFVEAAGIMQHLDLLVACDSGVAHVAGALGTKVMMLISLAAYDGRWGLTRETPWYPGHTIFRQSPSCDWNEVVWDVRDRLESDIRHGAYRRS